MPREFTVNFLNILEEFIDVFEEFIECLFL